MKHIKLLDDVQMKSVTGEPLVDASGTQVTLSHCRLLMMQLNDRKFIASFDTLSRAQRIKKAIEEADQTKAPYVQLETDDWNLLKQVVESPSDGYTIYGHCAFELIKAVIDATELPPESKQEAEKQQ